MYESYSFRHRFRLVSGKPDRLLGIDANSTKPIMETLQVLTRFANQRLDHPK